MKNRLTKILSIVLSLTLLITVCGVATSAQDSATVPSYYVKYGGTGDGTTKDTPAGTVAKAIAKINADGLGAGDTANVYIMQDEALTTDGKATIDGTTNEHNITAWCDTAAGEVVPAYTAELVIQPYDTSITTYFAESTRYNDVNPTITLNGPTTLNCLDVVAVRSFYNKPIILVNGNDFTYIHSDGYASFHGLNANGSFSQSFEIARISTGRGTVNGVTNINLNGAALLGTLWVGSQDPSDKDIVHKEDVNITLDHPKIGYHGSMGLDIQLGGQNITFEKNLNVIVKDVADIQFTQGTGTVTVNGGVNYMVAPDETVTKHLNELTCFAEGTKIYTLKPVAKEVMDLFTFTDEAGTYKVADGKGIVATDEDGNQYKSENGILKVPESGVYSIDEYILPVTKEFFVKNGGTGDGTTRENPAASVAAVMDSIVAANLASRDTALITVLERDDWNAAPVNDAHNMTYIGDINSGVAPKIIVQGDPQSENKVHLAYNAATSAESGRGLSLKETLTIKNVILVGTCRDSWIHLNGNSLILEDSVDFTDAYQWTGGNLGIHGAPNIAQVKYNDFSTTHTEAQNIEISANLTNGGVLRVPGVSLEESIFSSDNTIVLDNANIGKQSPFTISFAGSHPNEATAKYKNLNINVKNAAKVDFVSGANANGQQFVSAAAIQAILNANATYNTIDLANISSITETTPVYVLYNKSGAGDVLSFTKTAGTYKVENGYVAVATNTETRKKYTSESYVLTLPEAGTYNIELVKEPDAKDYYVMNGGTGDGRTPESPAPTVAAVIASVNKDLIKGDFANINIMQRNDWNDIPEGKIGMIDGVETTQTHNMTAWMGTSETFPTHTATIILKPYEAKTTYLAYCDQLGKNVDLSLYGPTIFEGVTLVSTRNASSGRGIVTGDNDVTFGANVSYGYVSCDEYAGSAALWNGVISEHVPDVNLGIHNTSSINNFNNGFTTTVKGKVGNIRIGTNGYGTNIFNENYNVVIDGTSSAPTFVMGGSHGGADTTFKKNVNISALNAVSVGYSAGKEPVTVEGGLQVIYREEVNIISSPADVSTLNVTGGIWEIVDKSDSDNALTFTETAGTFDVIPGFVAVATNTVTGEVTASVDGVLTIPAGKYEVIVCDYYANTGEKLYVYNASEVDVSTLEHNEKEGKLFIGWVDAATGEAVPQVDYYVYGDVLEAKYIDYDEDADFIVEEDQIRTSDSSLRYIFTQNKELTDKLPKITEFGALTLPTDTANGGDFFVDKAFVKSWNWDAETKRIFAPATYGTQAVKVVAKNILEENNEYLKYTLCLTNIEKDKTRTFYGACGYLTFEDLNGLTHTIYSEQMQSSLYKAAAEAPELEKTSVHNAIINYSEIDMTAAYWAANPITKYKSGVEGCADTDPNHLLYVQAGITIGDATVDTGIAGTEETEIFFFTDSHFNYTNEEDIASGNTTLLANYRARTWLGGGASGSATNNIMKYAENFKKIVNGGDAVDFVSDGCHNMTRRLIADKSVNGSIKMVLGNHETMETGGNALDEPYSNKWTPEEKMAMCQKYWTNDVYYDSEIMKNAQGDDNVMLIYLDNGIGKFWERQIAPLTRDLEYARTNNVPVLLFMHIPLVTHNENEKAVYLNVTYGGGTYGTADVNTRTFSYYDYSGFLGDSNDNADTQAVCDLIRQSSDVIKGVFNGHEHAWAYTEIVGIDENGSPDGTYIPQHTVFGAHYGGAMKITVK